MKLEYPINDSLPNVEHTRDRLLAKVFEFRANAVGKDLTTDEDFELLYAYGKCCLIDFHDYVADNLREQHWSPARSRKKSKQSVNLSSSFMAL